MLEAESSSSDSSSDPDSSYEDSSSDADSESDASDDPRDRRPNRRSSNPAPVNTEAGFTPPRTRRQSTVGRHLRLLVTTVTRHGADATIAGPGISTSLSQRRRSTGRRSKWFTAGGRNRRESPHPRRRAVSSALRLVLEVATTFAFAFSATPRERPGPGPFS